MSIRDDFKRDIAAARNVRVSRRGLLRWMAFCLPVIWLCDHFGRLEMAVPVLNCIAVFVFLIGLKWNLRGRAWFW